jgi:outer membrane protein insertion porin family
VPARALLAALLAVLATLPGPPAAAQAPPRDPPPEGEPASDPAEEQMPVPLPKWLVPGAPTGGSEAFVPEDLPEGAGPPPLPRRTAGEPPLVRAVEIRSDAALSASGLEQIRELVTFAPGERMTDEQAARTLRNVRASGLASRIAVLTRPAGDGEGVVAVIAMWGDIVVREVGIEGDTGALSRGRLRQEVPQREGYPLIESRLLRGVFAIEELLEANGHFAASVRLRPEIDEARKQAVVVYQVQAGPRSSVAEVLFAGELAPFTPVELLGPLRARPGEPFRRSVVEGDAERLEEWLVGEGYRTARVEEPAVERRPGRDEVVVTFPVTAGPKVEVEIVGADRKKLAKRDLLPFLGDEGYDEALVLLSAQRIRAWYQEQGHYDVRVAYEEVREGGTLHVTLTVEPGPRFELEEIDLVGNEQVSDDRLRELIQTAPPGLLSAIPFVGDGGGLVDDVLSGDVDNIRSYYLLQGFLDVEVGPPEVERRGEELFVTVPIVEGEQRLVDRIAFEGMDALDEGEVRGALTLEEGGPFHPAVVDESSELIRARYDRRGYNAAQVSATHDWNAERTRVGVTFKVLEGPQTVVDRIVVRGNEDTDASVIRRSLGLGSGEPVSTTGLLEAERDLYRLGIFSSVEVELTPAPLGASTRDVVVRVEEGKVQRVTYGIGYDSESGLGGILGYSHANLFGKAVHLALDARVSEKRQEYRAFLDQPYFFRYPVPVTYSLFRTAEERSSFEVVRRGARMEAVKQLGGTRLGLGYDYRIIKSRPLGDSAERNDLERQFQDLQVASLVPNVLLDRRNDPISPTDGWNSIAQVQYAFPLFAAEADWLKVFLQHVHYVRLGFGTLALSARAGGIEAFSALPPEIDDPFIPDLPGLDLPSEDVFLAERFFAGGSTTNRGYEQDELGIPLTKCLGPGGTVAADCAATIFPVDGGLESAGGNGLALVNVEYRFPIFGPVEGVTFVDTGNVWADWRQIDTSDFLHSVGVGVRYVSPVGPLRLDVGYPLNPIGDREGVVWFVSLGNPF